MDVRGEFEDLEMDLEIFGSGPLTRTKQWLLIRGDRRAVIGALFAVVYVTFVAASFSWPEISQLLQANNNKVSTLFNTLLSGVILLVSIVVSINSLSVSQELTTVGSQHDRVTESWNFREEAAEITGDQISPPVPGEFLKAIISQVEEDLEEFRELADDRLESGDHRNAEDMRDDMREYLDGIRDGLERTESVVANPKYAAINVAMFGSSYDVSEYVNSIRELQAEHGSALNGENDEIERHLDRIVRALQYFISAREYFKTVYYKREFSYLSRDLIYSGLTAILLISYVLLALGPDTLPTGEIEVFAGFSLFVPTQVLFLAFTYTIGLGPFLVLTAYTLRSAVIAQKTVSEGAFILD